MIHISNVACFQILLFAYNIIVLLKHALYFRNKYQCQFHYFYRMLRSLSLIRIISHAKKLLRRQQTFCDNDVMLLYREPGVTGEYRPANRTLGYYILSILQLNNETVNVWTHIIAVILLLQKSIFYMNTLGWQQQEAMPFLAFSVCSVAYALMSVIAHTCHSKSPRWHYLCFQLDYAGIGAYGLGLTILIFYTGCPTSLYVTLKPYFCYVQVLLSWIYMICCSIAKLKYRRPYPFQRKLWQLGSGALQGSLAGISIILRYWRCFTDSTCSMSSLAHHSSWIWFLSASLFFFSSHLPEVLFPGKFDLIGQGHQLFHVLVPIATLKQFDAAYIDMIENDIENAPRDIKTFSICLCLIVYAAGVRFIIEKLKPLVDKRIIEDIKCE